MPVRGSLAPVRGPLVLYDRSGAPINSGFDTNHREKASVAEFAPSLRAALLSSEDTCFWWHPGVDPIGITRALLVNIAGGQVLEGGSTLTQQLARSLYPNEVEKVTRSSANGMNCWWRCNWKRASANKRCS